MGESACLMQPFSYAAGLPGDASEGNPLHALGQSISFGRFMSEKLDWEKWSTFSSQNQHVAEAERYSRPGSVAQKKAFFEAHYKKLAAARKAAAEALLQQEENKPAPGNALQLEPKELAAQENVEGQNKKGFGSKSDLEIGEQEKIEVAVGDLVEERKVLVENPNRDDSKNKHEGAGDAKKNNTNRLIVSGTLQKENRAKVETKINGVNKRDQESTAKKQVEKPVLNQSSNACEEDSKPVSNAKPRVFPSSLSYGKALKSSNAPPKPAALVHSQKETITTPISRKPKLNSSEKTRMTPKSGYKSYGFTPVKEFNRLASIIRKIESSRAGSSSSKPSKDCKTPLRTPNTASSNGVVKNPLSTPSSDNRRGKVAPDSSAKASKTARAKWNFLPTENKLYSPSCFTPFGLRTEERAVRRKKKLEEKFKATEAQKQQQQQEVFREDPEKESSQLRQRLCFKARPLPNFYRKRRTTTEQTKKVLLKHQESPVVERKLGDRNIRTTQDKASNNSQRS